MIRVLLITGIFACPLQAETIMSAEEFDAYSSGSTVYFNRRGVAYGAEQYLRNRRVIWTFLDGQCQRGVWFAEGDGICFLYDGQAAAQCWHFLETGTGKAARVIGDDPADDLIVAGQDKQPLSCPGPGVGVSFTPSIIEE
ncbi:MAG: hypothetical protein AAGA12_12615 [Pseudomonadota bacterium]